MSESNIYKDHYELQQAYHQAIQNLQNIYSALRPLVAPEGVQMDLNEVISLAVDNLHKGLIAKQEHSEPNLEEVPEKSTDE